MLERRTDVFETWALKSELTPTVTSPSLFVCLLDSKARHMRRAPTTPAGETRRP